MGRSADGLMTNEIIAAPPPELERAPGAETAN